MSLLNATLKKFKPVSPYVPKGFKRWVRNNSSLLSFLVPGSVKRWVIHNVTLPTRTLIDVKSLKPKMEEACTYLIEHIGQENLGDYLEFGVYNGTSLSLMQRVLEEYGLDHVRRFGFDSFEGLPQEAALDDGGVWRPGAFYCNLKTTRDILTKKGIDWEKTFLIKGWFAETANEQTAQQYRINKASLIMIDCDLYSSTVDVLRFCASVIKDKAVLFFDDWNSNKLADKNLGQKKAFDEFLAANPHFEAEDFGIYYHYDNPMSRVFVVTNTRLRKK